VKNRSRCAIWLAFPYSELRPEDRHRVRTEWLLLYRGEDGQIERGTLVAPVRLLGIKVQHTTGVDLLARAAICGN
jgi:hypothetical protein